MKISKLLYCLCFFALLGCASSEPAPKEEPVSVDEIRDNAAQAYEELNAEPVEK
jgi:hypothetical protein